MVLNSVLNNLVQIFKADDAVGEHLACAFVGYFQPTHMLRYAIAVKTKGLTRALEVRVCLHSLQQVSAQKTTLSQTCLDGHLSLGSLQ